MFEYHTTAEGETMLIGQMSDSHLANMINHLCREVRKCSSILSGQSIVDKTGLLQAINRNYNQEKRREKAEESARFLNDKLEPYVIEAALRREKAEESARFFNQKLQPYVMEAALRGLNIQEALQTAYQRKTQMGNNQDLVLKGINGEE